METKTKENINSKVDENISISGQDNGQNNRNQAVALASTTSKADKLKHIPPDNINGSTSETGMTVLPPPGYVAKQQAVEPRSLKDITRDIKKALALFCINSLLLGRLLIEAKSTDGDYGNWEKWLDENFNMSKTTARRFMRFAEAVSNQPALADLGPSKADIVLRLPEKERTTFIDENDLGSIGVRDLEKMVKSLLMDIKGETETPENEKSPKTVETLNMDADIYKMLFSGKDKDVVVDEIVKAVEHYREQMKKKAADTSTIIQGSTETSEQKAS